MTAEEYIKAYTRGHSNELVGGGYHEWLTPENALAAVGLAREEMKEPASEDLEKCVVEQMEADGDVDDFVRRGIDDIASKYAALGARWQRDRDQKELQIAEEHGILTGMNMEREKMMKDAISGFIFGSRYFRQKNISLTNLSEEQYDKLKDFGERIKVIIIKE